MLRLNFRSMLVETEHGVVVHRKVLRRCCAQLIFVPQHHPCQEESLGRLQEFLQQAHKLFVLTGAGISTESGIPDYRSEGVGLYATSTKRPVQFKVFMESAKARQSYWARNYVGWPRFSSVQPNAAHKALAAWERTGRLHCIVTQNVDRLHHKAGSRNIHELHGSAFSVVCMQCQRAVPRHGFQGRLRQLNQHVAEKPKEVRPDGDVELSQEAVDAFCVPGCEFCGGIMKPDIVFFGDNVPRAQVENMRSELAQCDSLLVLGSSLSVYSGYRFILSGVELGLRMCGVNIGTTRADPHLLFRVNARCGEVLPRISL